MKKIVSLLLTLVMVFTLAIPTFAADNSINTKNVVPELTLDQRMELDEYGIDTALITKVLAVSEHIFFTEDGRALITDLSNKELSNQYGFTEKQITDFHAILEGTYQPPASSKTLPETRAARYYLSNYDLTAGVFAVLGTAAAAGPAALMAAWTGISTALAGPLGTIAGFSTAVLGATFFADLALKITGALVQGKGVAFYLDWGIPPVRTAIE